MLKVSSLDKTTSSQYVQNTNKEIRPYINLHATKPDSFEHSKNEPKTDDEYNGITTSLKKTGENAQTSLNGQLQSEGWAGKVVDKISALWNSKNRAHLVQDDIDKYNQQVEELALSIKENSFNKKFKEIFGVNYNIDNIKAYNDKAQQYKLAATTQTIAEITSSKLSGVLSEYKHNKGKLEDKDIITINRYDMRGIEAPYHETIPKEVTFKNMENALIDTVGSKEILDISLKSSGIDIDKATIDSKYNAYGLLAEYLIESSKATAKKYSEGKSLKEIKKEYDNAYQKAYGKNNDIQARVDKYNRSQEIGAAALRGATRYAASIALYFLAPEATAAKILYESAVVFGTKLIIDGSDKLSSNVKMDDKDIKKIISNTAVSAAERMTKKTLLSLIPGISTASDALNMVLDQATDIAINTTTGIISERIKYGKWYPNQIVPRIIIRAVFDNIDKSGHLSKLLIDTTQGTLKQIMSKQSHGDESIKQFLKGTRAALDEHYTKDNNTFGDLKKLADNQPDAYNEMMINLLKQMIEENQQEQTQQKSNKN